MIAGRENLRRRIGTLLVPIAFLAAIALGAAIVRGLPLQAFGAVLGVLFGAALLWIVVSVLWPARAERTCPRCGEVALQRMDPHETRGLVCRACGHRDETASAWLLAEDEGVPLEDIVMSERDRDEGGKAADSPVDTVRAGD